MRRQIAVIIADVRARRAPWSRTGDLPGERELGDGGVMIVVIVVGLVLVMGARWSPLSRTAPGERGGG